MTAQVATELLALLAAAEVWRKLKNDAEVARCHADMRAILQGVAR